MSELRQKILEASVALVAEQGVRAVSFREVARRAGVSHQAPYHHFGNVAGILQAIAREGFAMQADAMEAAAAKRTHVLDALEASGVAYVRFARAHPGHFRVMFQQALVAIAECEEAERTHGVLTRLSTAVHASGHGGGLSAEAIAHLCWSTVHGLALLLIEGTLERKGRALDERALTEQVVGGLRTLLEPKRKRIARPPIAREATKATGKTKSTPRSRVR